MVIKPLQTASLSHSIKFLVTSHFIIDLYSYKGIYHRNLYKRDD